MKSSNFCRWNYLLVLCVFLFLGCLPKEKKDTIESNLTTKQRYESVKDLSDIKVGYSTPTMDGPFYVALEQAVKSSVAHYNMQYISTDGQGDVSKQVVAVEDLLSKGIQVLILNPLDPKALVPIVERAKQQGVKVFILDSTIDDSAEYISSVLANNQLNGELLGEWLANQGVNEAKVALLSGNQGNPVGREKRLGFIRGLADGQLHKNGKTNFAIVSQGWGGWNNNGGVKAMEDMLVAHPYINVLVAENDAMALGALKTIDQIGKKGQIKVVGFDGQKEALQAIRSGGFDATMQNSPRVLGETMVEIIAQVLNDVPVSKVNYTPSILINKTNVNQFYDPTVLF